MAPYVNPGHPCGALHPLPEGLLGGRRTKQFVSLTPEERDPLAFQQFGRQQVAEQIADRISETAQRTVAVVLGEPEKQQTRYRVRVLDGTKVREMRALSALGVSSGDIAIQYGCAKSVAWKIVTGRIWKAA